MAHSSEPGETVLTDADGRLHHLLKPAIGGGGQGMVYQTQEPNIGIKLLTGQTTSTDVIRNVRRLPIEDLSSIAAPLSTIQEETGYVMVWLRDMVPLSHNRLPSFSRLDETIIDWFIRTGGLRRRLALSAKLAEILADLHARGLVYVDLNMANVMVSGAGQDAEVRLIDLDNLRSATSIAPAVLTPRWAAPELFEGSPSSRQSDSYSLALVSFATLTGYHPFDDGDRVRLTPEGSPERKAAALGQLPSFIDLDDTSNSTLRYLFPTEVILNPELFGAYRRVFGQGRHDVLARPTSAEWRRLLWQAHDLTATCECGFSTYITAGACASCDRPFDSAVTIEVSSPDGSEPSARIAVSNLVSSLSRRHLPLPVDPRTRHHEVMRMEWIKGSVRLQPTAGWICDRSRLGTGQSATLENEKGAKFLVRAVSDAR